MAKIFWDGVLSVKQAWRNGYIKKVEAIFSNNFKNNPSDFEVLSDPKKYYRNAIGPKK